MYWLLISNTIIFCLLARQLILIRKNFTPEIVRIKYTPDMIKAIFVEYWKDRYEELDEGDDVGAFLYKASKTDLLLDQLFAAKPPEPTEEQLVERSENVVPLHPHH